MSTNTAPQNAASPATETASNSEPVTFKATTKPGVKKATKSATKSATKPAVQRTVRKAVSKTPAKTPQKAVVKKTSTAPSKSVEKVTGQTAPKAVKQNSAKAAPKAKPAVEVKLKKPKLVRDSFTFPKDEYLAIASLKQRALGLKHSAKKSEILRAGLKLLNSLNDKAFLSALSNVPALKTGRPAKS